VVSDTCDRTHLGQNQAWRGVSPNQQIEFPLEEALSETGKKRRKLLEKGSRYLSPVNWHLLDGGRLSVDF
jgi:hypothetical protein